MASTSRLITLARGRCRREATVYVKGFGARDETSTDFAAWTSSHERIAAWNGSQALGFTWMRGSRRNQIPIPFITAARAATELAVRGRRLMRFTPGAVATHVAGDLGLHAARLVKQFYDAKAGAREDGQRLADALRALRLDSDVRTVRVVAHSLGCLATVEALALLPLSERPDEVHLCAPALSAERLVADDVANGLARPSLDALSAGAEMNRRRGTTSVYYCRDDVVLGSAFRFVELGALAVGQVGLSDLATAGGVGPRSIRAPPPRTRAYDVGSLLSEATASASGLQNREEEGRFAQVRAAVQRSSDAFRSHGRYAAAFDRIVYGGVEKEEEEGVRTLLQSF